MTNELSSGSTEPLLYGISVDRKWGFINGAGEMVIPPRFSQIGKFSEGLVAVRLAAECGFIDAKGDFIIGPGAPAGFKFPQYQNFYSYGDFHEGRARFWVGDVTGCGGYIDRGGKLVIPASFADVEDFSEGLACVSISRSEGSEFGPTRAGFIDPDGKFVIPPDREFTAQGFSGGRCVVSCQDDEGSWDSSVINRDGKVIVAAGIYTSISAFEGGLARVVKDGKVGCIEANGIEVVPVEFDQLWEFGPGESLTTGTKDGRSYTIDRKGRCVRELDVGTDAKPLWLRCGMVMVEHGGKRGFVDLEGRLVVPFEFDRAENFSGELAYAERDGWQGYIDRRGEFVWKTDRWDGPAYAMKAPLADFLPPGILEALPLGSQRGGVVNAIVFATTHPFREISSWLNKTFGGRFRIWDEAPLPDSIDFGLSGEGISVSLHVCDVTCGEAEDFANYHASEDLIMLLENHQPAVIGLLLLEEGQE